MFKNILFTSLLLGVVKSAPTATSSHPYQLHHDNGGKQTRRFNGQMVTDTTNGYTIIQDRNASGFGDAMRNEIGTTRDGELVEGDPAIKDIPKRLLPYSFEHNNNDDDENESGDDNNNDGDDGDARRFLLEGDRCDLNATSLTTGCLKNLVVLVRFSNHLNRDLPTAAELNIVFNHKGNHILAPTGSVRDFFEVNSYGNLTLESIVYDEWIDLPKTEAYYANGKSGFATKQYMEALHSAMDTLQSTHSNFNLSKFDGNNDGKVDMVTLVHSGHAAENYGTDLDGAVSEDRIWSHHRKLKRKWKSDRSDDAVIYQYGTVSAYFGEVGTPISRIGVICHEIGHALGLPDLYGKKGGKGIGSYDLMSNHWGFPTNITDTQHYPPIMSAWTKMKAGWVEPILITESGTYPINASQKSKDIYRINMDETGTEYLLIENRQAVGYDKFLPQGGLALWHIDETASNKQGYPGQVSGIIPWPQNQQHYKVALLQADGDYDLENAQNNGDEFDLFHADGVDSLAPAINYLEGPHPNTDSYKELMPSRTGVWINQISKSDLSMSFNVNFMNEFTTTFMGGNGASGNMFDILPTKDISIRKLYLNLDVEGPMYVELWTRTGTHVGYEKKRKKWQKKIEALVDGQGSGKKTGMDVGSVILNADTRYGFYLYVSDGTFRYTNGTKVGDVSASNKDLTVYEGSGLARKFKSVYNNRIWNGNILYDVLSSDDNHDRRRLLRGTSHSSQ